jgi:hypothetical protein
LAHCLLLLFLLFLLFCVPGTQYVICLTAADGAATWKIGAFARLEEKM